LISNTFLQLRAKNKAAINFGITFATAIQRTGLTGFDSRDSGVVSMPGL